VLEPDEDALAIIDGTGQHLVELPRDREVKLTFDLDISAAGPQSPLVDVESPHLK